MSRRVHIRYGGPEDVDALVLLDGSSFRTEDRFTRKQFRHLLTRANATTLILEVGRQVAGAAILIWRNGSSIGRIYTIAIDPAFQGRGLGAKLLQACEREASEHGCRLLTLEVRSRNSGAIALYERHGFQTVNVLRRYYPDGMNALRMTKEISVRPPEKLRISIPYYAQTLEFTCGPACLMMALHFHQPSMILNRTLELVLWKETTLIFMSTGFGGSGPFGLALAAQRRGFPTRVVLSKDQTPFFTSVRQRDKRRVIRLLHEDLKSKAHTQGVKVSYEDLKFPSLASAMAEGKAVIVLISTYHLHGDRAPHWVVLTGYDKKNVYFHDPYERFYDQNPNLARNVCIPIADFDRMRRYGKDLHKSVILIAPRSLEPKVSIDGNDL